MQRELDEIIDALDADRSKIGIEVVRRRRSIRSATRRARVRVAAGSDRVAACRMPDP